MSNFSPELTPSAAGRSGAKRWRVILYNNNFHRLDDVVAWLQETTGCGEEFAALICNTCHEQGRAVCFQESKEKCHQVASSLRLRGLQVEVDDY